jgi:hypothetical protein
MMILPLDKEATLAEPPEMEVFSVAAGAGYIVQKRVVL